MIESKKKRVYLMVFLLLIAGVLILLTILDSPASDPQSRDVSLRANTNDISLEDMMANNENKRVTYESGAESAVPGSTDSQPGDGLDDSENIARVQALIRENEKSISSGIVDIENERRGVTLTNEEILGSDDVSRRQPDQPKASTPLPSKKEVKELKADTVPPPLTKPKKRSAFNSISFGRESSTNAVKAYVHSEQTVMAGSTLKMRLGEDAYTDSGELIPKNAPIFGEVTSIDGERVIVKITHVNFRGNILPFEKQVYSKDAMLGIYVPGNPKADANKEVLGGAVDGLPSTIPGLDVASQIAGAVASTAVSAGKQVASKNVKKMKVTIKTNYEIYLRPEENN